MWRVGLRYYLAVEVSVWLRPPCSAIIAARRTEDLGKARAHNNFIKYTLERNANELWRFECAKKHV